MDELIASAKKEVLVEMVKVAQKREMAGSNGKWKEFLKFYDTNSGESLRDPSRRSVDSLAAFLKTFTKDDDLQFFKKVFQCHCNHNEEQAFEKISRDNETIEQRLVRLTLEHPHYHIDYSFPSHEEDWLIVKRCKKFKSRKSTKMIAIDCEMVLCKDGTEALVKVCAVDRFLQVKLDEVVNPNKEIADYRTDITGISATDLDGVTHSLKDVQRSLEKLLSHGTILVGHSLNNDLQALKLDYTKVIDTSYVFKRANGLANQKPSLSLLCEAMLGYELCVRGNAHNCLDDARAAMKLVLARLKGRIDDVTAEVKELDMAKLLIHRIPTNVPPEDLKSILAGDFTTKLKTRRRFMYAAFAIFKNMQEAVDAFENLEGDMEKDSCGRPQKLVKFELESGIAGTLCVCKVFPEPEDAIGQLTKKRSIEDEDDTPGVCKKLRTDPTSGQLEYSNQCETHLKEIERFKGEPSQKDQEISNLNQVATHKKKKKKKKKNKQIAALTGKQGL